MTNEEHINKLSKENRKLTNEFLILRAEFDEKNKICTGLNQVTIDSYRRLAELSTLMADKLAIVHENMKILAKIDPNW